MVLIEERLLAALTESLHRFQPVTNRHFAARGLADMIKTVESEINFGNGGRQNWQENFLKRPNFCSKLSGQNVDSQILIKPSFNMRLFTTEWLPVVQAIRPYHGQWPSLIR